MKTCTKCGVEQSLDNFSIRNNRKSGRASQCKACYNRESKDRECGKNRTYCPDKRRASLLRERYNMTVDDYDLMLELQDHSCKCCGLHKDNHYKGKNKIPLYVDHRHDTGQIRGLLCGACNSGIGHLQDSIEGVEMALNYLKSCEQITTTSPSDSFAIETSWITPGNEPQLNDEERNLFIQTCINLHNKLNNIPGG